LADANKNPEQIARDVIDARLLESGWSVQGNKEIDFSVALGVGIREYPTSVGPADYALFADRRALGVVEAKPDSWGAKITTVEGQSSGYAGAELKWVKSAEKLPFVYEATGVLTRFTDGRDPKPRSREVFTFHRPETLRDWFGQSSFRAGLQNLPLLNPIGLRDCQITALTNLEHSLKEDRPRALVQMATGSGKTFTAITEVYRLLKFAGARRVLFLVDTRNLGEQAEQEFMSFVPNDESRKFTELYTVQRLSSSYVSPQAQVCISTIQRMYSILKGEGLAEGAEDDTPREFTLRKAPLPVVYNPKLPPEFFDVVIIDECHRSIYNLWRQVIEYFDSFLVGLTATPDNRTYGFFQKNVVSEYTHEKAVADGVNVGNEVYTIDTEVTRAGAKLKAEQLVEKRERQTRAKRWQAQEGDEDYGVSQLDRSVVNPDQIRTVIRAFRDNLQEIFPGRKEVPKTLIFAKTDSHADDIIQTVRQEFGEGNDFCKKITYQTEENPKSVLSDFRNAYYPRIAVTVDMIATGTDVKPLECLLFMRDVKSASYFEQMKGRGTRVVKADDLKKVTPSAEAKTHYVIVDAVGVTKSLKTPSRPLDTKPSISFRELAMGVMMGIRDDDSVASLAARLARLDKQLGSEEQTRIEAAAGQPLTKIVRDLFDAVDGDRIEATARATTGVTEPDDTAMNAARDKLVSDAANVFNGPLIDLLDTIRRQHEQTIDHDNLDTLIAAEWAGDTTINAEAIAKDFESWLTEKRDEIEALSIWFSQPARRSEITFAMVKALLDAIKSDRPRLAPAYVWRAYAHLDDYKGAAPTGELTQLVALVRRVAGLDTTLVSNEDRVRRNFQTWILKRHSGSGEKFSEEQMDWLRMIRDHIATSVRIEHDDLDYAPFDGNGGLGRMHTLFGAGMNEVMNEMNEALSA
jgi:type I restriction enzyme, R subunit